MKKQINKDLQAEVRADRALVLVQKVGVEADLKAEVEVLVGHGVEVVLRGVEAEALQGNQLNLISN